MTQPAKHTPGPWVVHTFTISGKEKLEVLDATGTNACVQANAHLIAAAPAMYEALKDSLVLLEASYHDMHDKFGAHDLGTLTVFDCVEKVKAALAQAEARS